MFDRRCQCNIDGTSTIKERSVKIENNAFHAVFCKSFATDVENQRLIETKL